MSTHPFTLMQFATHPLSSCSFIMLILTILSFWVYRRIWVWGTLLASACLLAYYAKVMKPTFLIPVFFLLLAHWVLKSDIKGLPRFLTAFIATLLSLALNFHLIPDINNFLLASAVQISPNAPAFDYYWNFDKPFIALFILGLHLHLIENKEEFINISIKTCVFFVFMLTGFIFSSLYFNILNFDFKLPLIGVAWLIGNLFFTVIPEEVFFRGFLQRQISHSIHYRLGPYLANFLVSIGFAFAHYFFISSPVYISMAFIASFLYGLIFHLTQSIESCIFCHYGLNVVHFIFFTYPMLTSALSI